MGVLAIAENSSHHQERNLDSHYTYKDALSIVNSTLEGYGEDIAIEIMQIEPIMA